MLYTVLVCKEHTERRSLFLKKFGDRLLKMRTERGLTLREMASKIGVSYSSLAQYESGARTPRDDVKIAIAEFLGKSVQEIFFD